MASSWADADRFLEGALRAHDPVLDGVLAANRSAGLPAIDVSPLQGRLLMLVARLCGARRVLEIGTLGAYSTIWLARGLPEDGHVTTLEVSQRHADVAARNIARAGLSDRIRVRVGPALDTLAQLRSEDTAPFDLVFIDADKPNNPHYLEAVLPLSRPGTLVIVDNVVRGGGVVDGTDPASQGSRDALELLGRHPRLDARDPDGGREGLGRLRAGPRPLTGGGRDAGAVPRSLVDGSRTGSPGTAPTGRRRAALPRQGGPPRGD